MNYYLLLCALSLFSVTVPLTDPSLDDEFIDKEALNLLYTRYGRQCKTKIQLPIR
ncbi:hypothetical protein H0W26_04680 [Candidatus Dependentiae bacterium]|nr:hypothetical protein [Candidatus Dependentiae bacterium]